MRNLLRVRDLKSLVWEKLYGGVAELAYAADFFLSKHKRRAL